MAPDQRYYVRLIADDGDEALISHYEISREYYNDLNTLVSLWQSTHPKPTPAATPTPVATLGPDPAGCRICRAAHRHALYALGCFTRLP